MSKCHKIQTIKGMINTALCHYLDQRLVNNINKYLLNEFIKLAY